MSRGVIPPRSGKTGRQQARNSTRASVISKGTKPGFARKRLIPGAEEPAANLGKRERAAPRRYNPLAPERVSDILKRLDQTYPDVKCALTHRNAWELLVATILSAQSTDVRVNMVTPELFKKYPTVQDFARLEPQQLEPDVRSTGFFRNKSKSVVGAARRVVSEYAAKVPQTMEDLLTLPGVARKTANVVLGTWFKKAEGVV